MKKLCALVLALACLAAPAAAYNVQAPNSFDSARGTWEYKALYEMCGEGKSPKYGKDYFSRGGDISRYELAAVLIDILDRGKGLDADDEAALARMKKSYSRELEARGWHERAHKKPDIEISGDLRLRYSKGGDADARARVGVSYPIGSSTTVNASGKAEMDK